MSNIPNAPQIPVILWWIIAISTTAGFSTFMWSTAFGRTQKLISSMIPPVIGAAGIAAFYGAHELTLSGALAMYSCIMAIPLVGFLGNWEEARRLSQISAEQGAENMRLPTRVSLQFWTSFVIVGTLGIWFAGSA